MIKFSYSGGCCHGQTLLTGLNLGRVFNYKCGCMDEYMHVTETAKLIVENSAQTSFGFSPISFRAPRCYRYNESATLTKD
jgi:hypothetical protein